MCLRGSVEGSPHLGQGTRCVRDCSFLMCEAKGDSMYIRRPFFLLFRFYSVSSTTINLHLITYLDSDTVYHSSALSFLSQPRCHYRREVDHDRYYVIQLVIRQSPLLFESNHLHLVSFHPSSPHSFL